MAIFGGNREGEREYKIKCYCGHTTYCDCDPDPNESLKSAKEKYDEELKKLPYVIDDFQIVPDGAYENNSDWDATLMDGIEYEDWDELYEDYVGEFDLLEFMKWLKNNFHIPNKLR